MHKAHGLDGLNPGGGGFHTYIGSGHFWVQNFNIFGVFRKINIFGGYEDFVDIFWGRQQNWTIFRGHFYRF